MRRDELVTMTAEEAAGELNFVADVIYKLNGYYSNTNYRYVRACLTGEYITCDCYILDDSYNIAEGFETPVPINESELGVPVWED